MDENGVICMGEKLRFKLDRTLENQIQELIKIIGTFKNIKMKFRILIFLSTLIFLLACQQSKKDPAAKSAATITLTESKDGKSILTGRSLDESTRNSFHLNSKYDSEKILITGNQFVATLDHSFPQIIELSYGRYIKYPIYITPRDSINLEYYENDLLNNFAKISFSGDHVKENETLLELKKLLKYNDTNNVKFFNCSEEVFLSRIDSIQNIANGILSRFKARNETGQKDFEILAQSYIDFTIAKYLEDYPSTLEHTFKQGAIELSDSYMAKRKSYSLNQSYHLNNFYFVHYAFEVVGDNARKKFKDVSYDRKGKMFPDINIIYSSIDSIFENKKIIDYLKFRTLQGKIQVMQKKPAILYKEYQALNPDPIYLLKLEETLSKIRNPDKDYVFKDMDGKDRYLSEFKDKIVYIDFWATWCGPCLQERPHFEALIEKFSDNKEDIVFLGISIDTDIRKWRSLVTVEDMKGVQLLSPQGFKSEICQDFKMNIIPRFMILNKDGEFIEPNAMRPSGEGIYRYLDGLVKEDS